jgi:hypothetical protein
MTHQGVGATGNEFVIFLHSDGLAPILSEVTARPDRKEETDGGDCRTAPEAPSASRKKSLV